MQPDAAKAPAASDRRKRMPTLVRNSDHMSSQRPQAIVEHHEKGDRATGNGRPSWRVTCGEQLHPLVRRRTSPVSTVAADGRVRCRCDRQDPSMQCSAKGVSSTRRYEVPPGHRAKGTIR